MSKNMLYLFLSIVLLSLASPAAADFANDPELIVYYSFDEFGDVVPDLSGKGNDGVVEGDITFEEEGYHDGAANFATGSYLDLNGADFAPEYIPTTAITIVAWAKCEDTGGHHALLNTRGGDSTWVMHPEFRSEGNFRWLLRSAGGNTIFDIRDGEVTWDEWQHFAGTYDQTTGRAALYINGVTEADQTINNPAEICGDWDLGARVGYNIDNARPFTGLMDDFCCFKRALSKEEVLSIMVSVGARGPAFDPIPEEETVDVVRDVTVSWSAGPFAATHDVYLGTNFDDVNDASRANPLDVLVSEGQADTTYPVGLLEYNQTYYWRVDEVNAAPDETIFKGAVWSFTTEPLAYPIENIIATTNLASDADAGPENTVNGSGLNEADEHSTKASDMWLAEPAGEEPLWIQYEFDRVYKLHEIDVWNYNAEFELILGFGLKDVTVEYSTDGAEWTVLEAVELAQATAAATYTANTLIDGTGVAAKYVRMTIQSGYSTMGSYGLSEVRFLYIPAQARLPEPVEGVTDVDVDAVLTWRAGREAASHDIYLGTDAQAVADGTAPVDSATTNSYAVDTLDFGATYYWKVNEVNEAEAISMWEGDLWSFTTQEYGVVEDFEAYDNEENRIYDTWIDGWINGSGSIVGYATEPFAETKTVHGGKQSMPLEYYNDDAPYYSEASRTFAAAQDWTAGGADSLQLYFYGDADNAADTLYVAIEDSSGQVAVVSYSDADAVLTASWQEWTIPLSELSGVNLASISTVTVGLGDRNNPSAGGSGLVLIDDIGVGHPVAEQ